MGRGGVGRAVRGALVVALAAGVVLGCRDVGIEGNGEARELWFDLEPNIGMATAAVGCATAVAVRRRVYERDIPHHLLDDRSKEVEPPLGRVTCEGDPCPLRDLGSRPTNVVELQPTSPGTIRLTVSVTVDDEPIEDTLVLRVLPNATRTCPPPR